MKLSGKKTFQASPAKLWHILMDTEKLARISPGLSRLEALGDDQYTSYADVKVGPVKGSFKGKMSLTDKHEPEKFTLNVNQQSKIGNVKAAVTISLRPESGSETTLSFEGEAKLSGLLARTGARVMTGVSNSLTKQFFEELEKELAR